MDVIQRLGKYEIRGTLGKGAMGTVYDGWDPAIARRVAIKTVNLPSDPDPDTAEEIARFRREAQAAGRLTHPNIVAVYDYGETSDMAYIVMEFVDGPSLKAPLDARERLALTDIQRVMTDLLTGLQFSHERGVVHRDIKPANIMLTTAGQAKIADFGIARIETSSMTQAGTMLGTPSYMSPEQFRGEVVDARTDVYSSGVVLYQLLTGERPFEGGLTAIMHKVLTTEPPWPSQISGTCPAALDAVVQRAMAKRPDDRFASAAAFAEGIKLALSAPAAGAAEDDSEATMVGATLARPAPRPAAPRPAAPAAARPAAPAAVAADAPARSKLPLLIGAGAVVVVLALGVGGWFMFAPSSHAPVAAVAPGPQATGQPATGQQATGQPTPGQQAANQQPASPTGSVAPSAAPSDSTTAPPNTGTQTGAPATTPTATSTPAPTTTPATTAAPTPTQEATTDLHALRQQLAQAMAQASCTLANGLVQDSGAVSVAGFAGTAAAASLRQQLSGVAGAVPVDWRVQPIDQVFCNALGLLRPIAAQAGAPISGLSLTLAGGVTTLRDGARIMPRITMADYAGFVRVDYLGHDGSVVHLYPTAADPKNKIVGRPATRLTPGAQLSIGEGGPNQPEWDVGPPYGTDMIIAVASSSALLARAPAQNAADDAGPYLRDLADGIARVRQSGGQVAGTLLLVDTIQK